MKVEHIAKEQVLRIVREELNKQNKRVNKELDRFRERIIELERHDYKKLKGKIETGKNRK